MCLLQCPIINNSHDQFLLCCSWQCQCLFLTLTFTSAVGLPKVFFFSPLWVVLSSVFVFCAEYFVTAFLSAFILCLCFNFKTWQKNKKWIENWVKFPFSGNCWTILSLQNSIFSLMFMIHEWCHKLMIKHENACFSFCDEKSGTLCVFCLSLSRNPAALKHRAAVNIQCLEVLDTCHRCLLLLLLCQRSPLSWHHITGLLCKALTNTVTFWTLADIHPPAPTFFTCFTAISSMWKSAACRSSPVSAVTLKHPSPKHSLDIELCPLNTNDCMSEIGLFFPSAI